MQYTLKAVCDGWFDISNSYPCEHFFQFILTFIKTIVGIHHVSFIKITVLCLSSALFQSERPLKLGSVYGGMAVCWLRSLSMMASSASLFCTSSMGVQDMSCWSLKAPWNWWGQLGPHSFQRRGDRRYVIMRCLYYTGENYFTYSPSFQI